MIICGDVGVCWSGGSSDSRVNDTLSDLPVTTLFIDGNHENFDLLDDILVEEWFGGKVQFINNSIIHLMRGHVYTIDDKTFFTFGGAYSTDRLWRTDGLNWWKQEIPSIYEMEDGLKNLKKHHHKIDYIVTHTAPYEVLVEFGIDIADDEEEFVYYLDQIRMMVDFKKWFFGHLHMDEQLENFYALYKEVIEITED